MNDERLDAFWRSFVEATGIDGPHTAWGFGYDDDPEHERNAGCSCVMDRSAGRRAS